MQSKLANDLGPDLPDADVVYRNYLGTRRLLHIEPLPRDQARELVAEWSSVLGEALRREYGARMKPDAATYAPGGWRS